MPEIPMLYTEWQQRVYEEHLELLRKCEKLRAFLATDQYKALDATDARHLALQLNYMLGYLQVLNLRIQRFNRVDRT